MFVSTASIVLPTNVDATPLSGFEQTVIFDLIDVDSRISESSGVDCVSEMEMAELMSVLADFVTTDTPQPNTVERAPFTSIGNIPNARPATTANATTIRRRRRVPKENVKPLSATDNRRRRRATPGSLVEAMLRPTTRPW
ncbi:hypothetical protein VNI00_010573 [Paramarasmius palmivorus]|uniref:Uncharacterized protein n=1 Tax=Paramarasmius palmivorus TaxID=297713 RepID=A0AAW0CIF0_9AGAR